MSAHVFEGAPHPHAVVAAQKDAIFWVGQVLTHDPPIGAVHAHLGLLGRGEIGLGAGDVTARLDLTEYLQVAERVFIAWRAKVKIINRDGLLKDIGVAAVWVDADQGRVNVRHVVAP